MLFPIISRNYPGQHDFQVYPEYLDVMIWSNIHVCLPFTFLVIALCFAVRLDHIPATYYVNLLVSNLIQIITLIVLVEKESSPLFFHYFDYSCSGTASFCFRTIIALERFLFMSKPECHFMRQAKGFVTICLPVWIFSGVLVFLLKTFGGLSPICFLFLAALLSLICLAATLKLLCASTSMPAKLKCRNMGIVVLLLVNCIVTVFPTGVYFIYLYVYNCEMERSISTMIIFTLNLYSPVMDLILFVFMSKGPFIKLLLCLCCCRKKTPAVNDSSSSSV